MSDLGAYFLAQANKREAFAKYDGAAKGLELAQVRERLAEIKSQHEPLAGLLTKAMSERDRLYAAAFYVVVGRFPELLNRAQDEGRAREETYA